MTITRLKIPQNNKDKLELIKKYSSKKSFWTEFDDDRPFNDEDHLKFLLPVASKIRKLEIIGDDEKRNIFRRLKAMWDINTEALGKEATPRDVVISFFNFTLMKMYKAGNEAEDWLSALNTIFEVYFTKERINNFNKFSVVK